MDITVDFCSTPTSADSALLAGFGNVYVVFRFIDAISVENVIVSDCYTIVNYPRVKLIEWERPLWLNLDVDSASKASRLAHALAVNSGERASGGRADRRFTFPVEMCVDPMAPFPFRTADACICTKDLPLGADAWLEPPPPFDLMPGQCQPCSLIVFVPDGVVLEPGHAVYVNGWFWGNSVAEGGVSVYFVTAPPLEATISEI